MKMKQQGLVSDDMWFNGDGGGPSKVLFCRFYKTLSFSEKNTQAASFRNISSDRLK